MQPGLSPHPPSVLEQISAVSDAPARGDRLVPGVPFSRKIALTGLSVALLLAVPYAHPALSRLRLFKPREAALALSAAETTPLVSTVGEAALPGETKDDQARARELEAAPVDARSPIAHGAPEEPTISNRGGNPLTSIEDASGHALAALFAKLAKVERKEAGAVARILYYGDSIVGSDFVTGKLR